MDVSITRQMVTDQAHHKEIITAMVALGGEFLMRAATRDGEPDNEAYEKWSKQQIAKTKFQALEQALMATYVGLQQGMETPNQQLAKLNMIRYEGRTMMYDDVQQRGYVIWQNRHDSKRVQPRESPTNQPIGLGRRSIPSLHTRNQGCCG
ncbi:unnamed protein product [Cylindrotheca closterium]|uniref:Uncharacterized protein n=1 Tax=Cylindrotheca closterium TaxID=2856 RepID=A0AAD2CQC7_9STRA|nr:unnamed protein product [Cylindrotheca closterium]